MQVEYKGKPLTSMQKCWRTFILWDKNGKSTKWSAPAYFEIELLNPSDCKADWIKPTIKLEANSYPSPPRRLKCLLSCRLA